MLEAIIITLGLVAATCTTISFLPQAIKVIRTKHTSDLSLAMYSLFTFGVFLWLVYGFFLKDIPLIAANTVTLILSSIILAMKLKYK